MATVTPQLIKELREITAAGILDAKKALEATNASIDDAIVWLRENGLAKAAKKADRVASEGVTMSAKSDGKAIVFEVNSETDFVSKNEKFMSLINGIKDSILNSNATDIESILKVKMDNGSTIQENITSATATIGEKIELRRCEVIKSESNNLVSIYNHANKRISVLLVFEGSMPEDEAYNVAMHVAAMAPKYLSLDEVPQKFKDDEMHIIKETTDLTGKPENIAENILKGKLSKKLAETTLLEQPFVMDEKKTVGQFIKSKNAKLVKMIRFEVGEGIEKATSNFAEEVAAQLKGK